MIRLSVMVHHARLRCHWLQLEGLTDWITAFYNGVKEFLAAAKAGAIKEMSLPLLLDSLRLWQDETTFARTKVNEKDPYYNHALKLAEKGYKYVILGHTHLAKRIEIGEDAVYFNTGTWADLIQIPHTILHGKRDVAMALLREFMSDIEASELKDWIKTFTPTHVMLDLDENGKITDAKLFPKKKDEDSQGTGTSQADDTVRLKE